MADEGITIRTVKTPAWMHKGIDLTPYTNAALDSISTTLKNRQGKGLGAKRNEIVLSTSLGARRIDSTVHHPRETGKSWIGNAEWRFNSVAPNAVRKYVVKPLEAEWAASS